MCDIMDMDFKNINDEIIKQILFSTSTYEYLGADYLIEFDVKYKIAKKH